MAKKPRETSPEETAALEAGTQVMAGMTRFQTLPVISQKYAMAFTHGLLSNLVVSWCMSGVAERSSQSFCTTLVTT